MAKKMSNKARIQQKAEEAAAAKKEKETKKKTTKKKTTKKTAAEKKTTEKKTTKKVTKKKTTKKRATTRKKAAAVRMKVVWKVFDANYREVACFLYPDKKKAYATAEKLIKKKKVHHFVNAVQVPMEEE